MEISIPYHLCPICGMQSKTTSRICLEHITITYDSSGQLISYVNAQKIEQADTPEIKTWGGWQQRERGEECLN